MTDREQGGDYSVALDQYEGPLDLLLLLIQKHELDILDIPVAFVLEKYLEYIDAMKDLRLEAAAEYLAMAATLVHIKGRMLLPGGDLPVDEEGTIEDPRAELVRRLLEYKKYREAAAYLGQRSLLGDGIFTGGFEPDPEEAEVVAGVGIHDLVERYIELVKEARARGRAGPDVFTDRRTVAQRISQVAEGLARSGQATFRQLLGTDFLVFDVVITFLAILEMARLRMIRLAQADDGSDIMITEPPPVTTEPPDTGGAAGSAPPKEGEDGTP